MAEATLVDSSLVGDDVKKSPFANSKAPKSLRVCCFGSSSSQTPGAYLKPSAEVGYLLAVRGHVCVNGAGSFGCMAAMNYGAVEGNGHIVGVIHEMWLKGGEDVKKNEWGLTKPLRDGGAHVAFATKIPQSHGGPHPALTEKQSESSGPIRELLVAGGKDLQERKKLLIENADALVVMPGGPGTFDELWEMACARNIGLSTIPIVCVNVNGFYDSFRVMLQRAWDDKLTKLRPAQIIHFADTPEEAIKWVEDVQGVSVEHQIKLAQKNEKDMLRYSSVVGSLSVGKSSSGFVPTIDLAHVVGVSCIFAVGILVGASLSRKGRI